MRARLTYFLVVATTLLAIPFSTAIAALGDSSNPLVVASQGGAATLDPIMRSENTAYSWQRHIFDTVTVTTRDGEVVPRIATAWKNLSPLKWQLTLRKDVKFHDGSAMTAEDVGKSILDARQNPRSQVRPYVASVEDFKVTGENTIVVSFSKPDPVFPIHLAMVPVMPERQIAEEGRTAFTKKPIGTGPYKFVSWNADNRLILEAWDGFWGDEPAFKHVKLLAIPNSATRIASLLSGQVQVVEKIEPANFSRVENSGNAYITIAPGQRTMYLAMDYTNKQDSPGMPNGGRNPFMQPEARKAIDLAINRELINQKIFGGQMTIAKQFLPASIEGHDPDAKALPHAPDEAKKLLAEASDGDGFEIRLDAPNDRYLYDSLVAQALGGVLGEVGVTVNVNAVPKTVFFPSLDNGKFTMYFAGWGSIDAISTWNAMFHCPNKEQGFGSVNREGYCNKQADEIMATAAQTFDTEKRVALEQKAYGIALNQDYAYLPLYFQNVIAGVSSKVGWESRPDEMIFAWQMTRK